MAWTELSDRIDYTPDIAWTPTITAEGGGSSGWTPGVCRYKIIGNLVTAYGVCGGNSVVYGNGIWRLGGLPYQPYAPNSFNMIIGSVYFYNVGRASYGHVVWQPGSGAFFLSAHASNAVWANWAGSWFDGSGSGRSLAFKLFYEAT